jgi:hypothetical protein
MAEKNVISFRDCNDLAVSLDFTSAFGSGWLK